MMYPDSGLFFPALFRLRLSLITSFSRRKLSETTYPRRATLQRPRTTIAQNPKPTMTSTTATATRTSPIRLAILEADTPLPQTAAQYQTYGGVFTSLFARAVSPDPVTSALTITAHDVVSNPTASPEPPHYPDLEAVDAVLVTGSRHSAFSDEPWIAALAEYVRRAVTGGRVRVVGVCFGHQIVGRALGAPVAKGVGGWEVSVTEIRLTEKGKEVFGGRETLVSLFFFFLFVFGHVPPRVVVASMRDLRRANRQGRKSTRCTAMRYCRTRTGLCPLPRTMSVQSTAC